MSIGEKMYQSFRKDGQHNFNSLGEPVVFNDGFMVSMKAYTKTFPFKSKMAIVNHLNKKVDELKGLYKNAVIGFWVDDTGVLFLDISINVNQFDVAMLMAIQNQQEAIFDCRNGVIVNVDEYLENMGN